MGTHLRQKAESSESDVTARKHTVEEEEEETAWRKRRREEEPDSVSMTTCPRGDGARPCVSIVIRVEQKEGVTWRNVGEAGSHVKEVGLILCFSVRAAVIGPVVSWGHDPKNRPMMDRETDRRGEDKVRDTQWFP